MPNNQRAELERIITKYLVPFPFSPPKNDDAARVMAPILIAHIASIHRAVAATMICDPGRIKELHLPDGKPSGVYFCTLCRCVYSGPDQATCCSPRYCLCGAELPRYRTGCDACFDRQRAQKAAARWKAATTKTETEYGGGMVYVEDDRGLDWGGNDGWHGSINELRDAVADWREDHPDESLPTLYVYGSTPQKMTLSADGIIEDALGDFHEDASDEIGREAEAELQALLDAWCEANGPTTHVLDYGTKIVDWNWPIGPGSR